MRPIQLPRLAAAALALAAATAFAQVPTFTVVNHGLDATFGNAGKGVLEPQVAGITGVAFGASLFVVVANSSGEDTIRWATSADGTVWTARSQAIGGGMKTFTNSKVHFLNGKFMFFAAHSGSVSTTWCYTSADGLTWTQNKVADARLGFEEFDSSPTLTVVGGSNGGQVISTDLVTWTSRPVVPNGSGYDHLDVAYGNDRFFSSINGFGGTTYSSTDGITWTAVTGAGIPGGSRVETGNNLVIINAGSIYYRSTDGITFPRITTTIPTGWLGQGPVSRFTGGRFLCTAAQIVGSTVFTGYLSSTDGLAWTAVGLLPATPAAAAGTSRLWITTDIAFGNGKYVHAAIEQVQTVSTKVTTPIILTLDGTAAPTPPTITTPPAPQSAVLGGTAAFTVAASGTGNTFQWRKDTVNITGATAATLTLTAITAANAGTYTVVITNAAGSVTSPGVTLTLVTASNVGRLINLSVLTGLDSPTDEFTLGYVVGGAGTSGVKPLVIRAAGPSLGALGVPGTLADPKMELFAGSNKTGENDNWGGGADIAAAMAGVGAFPYAAPTSRDAAVAANITTRDNSVRVTGIGGATGAVIAEVYDASPASSFSATTPRLLNVSVRKHLGTGLTAGFVVGGATSARVLIRVAGPGLAQFGVPGTVVDPQLALFNAQSVQIAANNDWANAADITAAGASVGAFALPANSRDAALVVTLAPGNYSVRATGVNSTTGVALVEVYELP